MRGKYWSKVKRKIAKQMQTNAKQLQNNCKTIANKMQTKCKKLQKTKQNIHVHENKRTVGNGQDWRRRGYYTDIKKEVPSI